MVHEIEIRREVAHRLDATFKVLSAKIGKHGSATHHLANVLGAMSNGSAMNLYPRLGNALQGKNWANLVSGKLTDFAKRSQAAMSIPAIDIPVNPCGPSNRNRP
jgi:hypothetical protein